jgi:predicted Fe-Mo cluster-binding NifX family protein
MKICIPLSDDRGTASPVHGHFGSAPYFAFVELPGGEAEIKPNPQCGHEHGSCHHTKLLAARGVDAVACTGMGKRALLGLTEAGITVYALAAATLGDAIAAMQKGEVPRLTLESACGGHGHGPGHEPWHGHGHEHGRHRGGGHHPA